MFTPSNCKSARRKCRIFKTAWVGSRVGRRRVRRARANNSVLQCPMQISPPQAPIFRSETCGSPEPNANQPAADADFFKSCGWVAGWAVGIAGRVRDGPWGGWRVGRGASRGWVACNRAPMGPRRTRKVRESPGGSKDNPRGGHRVPKRPNIHCFSKSNATPPAAGAEFCSKQCGWVVGGPRGRGRTMVLSKSQCKTARRRHRFLIKTMWVGRGWVVGGARGRGRTMVFSQSQCKTVRRRRRFAFSR